MDSSDHRDSTNQSFADGDATSELAAGFSDTARILFTTGSVTETLAKVVELAVTTVEGCDLAGLLLEKGLATSPIYTDPILEDLDAFQHESGDGPGFDAITQRIIFYADDLVDDPRWPGFVPRASAAGIRSVLALPLTTNGQPGALILYGRYPAAFGVVDRAKAVILASLAGVAVSAARSRESEERRVDNLTAALATRELIGQAQGILMERERIASGQAFDILRRASQHLNRKLRDVAQDLVDTGAKPETGASEPA
jgi:GAF domain-containing protein